MNVIRQIVDDNAQTIKMIVKSNERGPQGEQGEPGVAATIEAGEAYSVPYGQAPAVMNSGTDTNAKFDFYIPRGEKGEPGKDGSFQYKAGVGIKIEDDTISMVGGGSGDGIWGLVAGNIEDQTDLQQEFAKYTPTTDLATVATSGSYNDLSNKPTIPVQVQADWTEADSEALDYIKNKPTLAAVATSGSYNDLSNKPESIIELTSNDYNWPTNNPTGIALWLMEPGIYMVNVRTLPLFIANTTLTSNVTGIFIVSDVGVGNAAYAYITHIDPDNWGKIHVYKHLKSTGALNMSHILGPIADNLNTNSGEMSLSARQGKVLNEKIPTITMQTTDPGEGATLAANNFIAVYSA